MIMARQTGHGTLWSSATDVDEQTLPFWRALIIALGIEIIIPFLIYGVNWSFLPSFTTPDPVEVMSVRLEEPPSLIEEPPPPLPKKEPEKQKKQEPKSLKEVKNVTPIELPKPLPNELPSPIEIPKPKPKPKPKRVENEEPRQELPPLPSVFRDIKPVRKVKPNYPREAEDRHIEGRVKVRLNVALDGTVSDVKILVSEPPGVFDEEVLKAVWKYQFKRDGTTYQADQEIIFKIDP